MLTGEDMGTKLGRPTDIQQGGIMEVVTIIGSVLIGMVLITGIMWVTIPGKTSDESS